MQEETLLSVDVFFVCGWVALSVPHQYTLIHWRAADSERLSCKPPETLVQAQKRAGKRADRSV